MIITTVKGLFVCLRILPILFPVYVENIYLGHELGYTATRSCVWELVIRIPGLIIFLEL